MKIAIIDVLGLVYDGNTLKTKGIGGSEAWTILASRNLVQLGMEVSVFNHCVDVDAKEGVYDGVQYIDISRDYTGHPFDIVIGSRSITPFVDPKFAPMFGPDTYKTLFAHDTFFQGDPVVENLLVNGTIDRLFTLSDFHTFYLSTCHHGGNRRNPEVLKNKIFMTRNGVERHLPWVDITKKDRNLFIYNASQTKGMTPLVERIWPLVKTRIPDARLIVIGGYYRFNSKTIPDAQEIQWRKYADDPALKGLDITFTGIIPQPQIAQLLSKASFVIYPSAFPETSGISTMEALAYNVPLLTCTFGALEETAIDMACYKIPYAIEPNSLFPNINIDEQVRKFVDMTVAAYHNTYLHSQKMNYCSIIHEVCDWRSIMLQWKQHFYREKGLYFPVEEYREVQHINQRVHQIFGRRFSNPEEWTSVPIHKQERFIIISPFYNGADYIEDCIRSVASQDYDNYIHVLIDDASTDGGYDVAMKTISSLPKDLQEHFVLHRNETNIGSVANYVEYGWLGVNNYQEDSIIMMLDGDDSLMPRNDIFHMYNRLYHSGAEFTYGSCWSMIDNIPLIGQDYPKEIRDAKAYRTHRFAWNAPYTHFRTFRKRLLDGVPRSVYKDAEGNWLRAGGDMAIFFNAIEQADPDKVVAVKDVVYKYNDRNPICDFKVNGEEQTRNASYVLAQ